MSALTSTEKLVLLAVLAHWSRTDERPFPSNERIGKWTSLSTRAVIRILHALERKGAIGVARAPGRSNRYDLRSVFTGELDPCPTVTPDTGSPLTEEQGTPDTGSPVPLTQGHPKGSMEGIHEGIQLESARARTRTKRSPGPSKKNWRRVPVDFEPGDEHRRIAGEEGKDFERELARFRDHEFATPKTDANATFRNWLRNEYGGARSSFRGETAADRRTREQLGRVDMLVQQEQRVKTYADIEREEAAAERAALARRKHAAAETPAERRFREQSEHADALRAEELRGLGDHR
jgi:hypothetical protein